MEYQKVMVTGGANHTKDENVMTLFIVVFCLNLFLVVKLKLKNDKCTKILGDTFNGIQK